MKLFLIEKKGRGGYYRLREQREQKQRDMQMYVYLMDITLEIGNQREKEGEEHFRHKKSMGESLVQRGNMVNLKN